MRTTCESHFSTAPVIRRSSTDLRVFEAWILGDGSFNSEFFGSVYEREPSTCMLAEQPLP